MALSPLVALIVQRVVPPPATDLAFNEGVTRKPQYQVPAWLPTCNRISVFDLTRVVLMPVQKIRDAKMDGHNT